MKYQEIKGDLIQMALNGDFQVITHGCNCMCTMGAGIAPLMAKAFGCDRFTEEHPGRKGDILKLGNIDWQQLVIKNGEIIEWDYTGKQQELWVINSYTQYNYGKNHLDGDSKPLDYEALTMCLRKINHEFRNMSIGLPQIGCGLAGGDWSRVKQIIQEELSDMDVTVVIYNK